MDNPSKRLLDNLMKEFGKPNHTQVINFRKSNDLIKFLKQKRKLERRSRKCELFFGINMARGVVA